MYVYLVALSRKTRQKSIVPAIRLKVMCKNTPDYHTMEESQPQLSLVWVDEKVETSVEINTSNIHVIGRLYQGIKIRYITQLCSSEHPTLRGDEKI